MRNKMNLKLRRNKAGHHGNTSRAGTLPSSGCRKMARITLLAFLGLGLPAPSAQARPRVFVFSDIKVGYGDADDRQSMAHLMYYANEVDIRGIHPDASPEKGSILGVERVLDRYEQDYHDARYRFRALGYPPPDQLRTRLSRSRTRAEQLFAEEIAANDPRPLYVLVWGSLANAGAMIRSLPPAQRKKIRLLTIATNIKDPTNRGDGRKPNYNNWNSFRTDFYRACPDVFWIEMDWTYQAMHLGKSRGEPGNMVNFLADRGGALGRHIKQVIQKQGNYFRAGDTPTLLYLLDPGNDPKNPEWGSWAGRFTRPFPATRPNYYTGISGGVDWNYAEPWKTWSNAKTVYASRLKTLLDRRTEMYGALMDKIHALYGHSGGVMPVVTQRSAIPDALPPATQGLSRRYRGDTTEEETQSLTLISRLRR